VSTGLAERHDPGHGRRVIGAGRDPHLTLVCPAAYRHHPVAIHGRDFGDQYQGRVLERAFCSVRVFQRRRGSAVRRYLV